MERLNDHGSHSIRSLARRLNWNVETAFVFLLNKQNLFAKPFYSFNNRYRIIHPLQQLMLKTITSLMISFRHHKPNSWAIGQIFIHTVPLFPFSICYLSVLGRTHIRLKKSGEIFSIIPPTSRVCNLIIGRTWIDTFGPMSILNVTTGESYSRRFSKTIVLGDRAELEFVPCGWFSSGRYEYSGVLKINGDESAKVSGLWNRHCDVEYNDTTIQEEKSTRLWICADKPQDDDYGRTYFCYKCNSCSGNFFFAFVMVLSVFRYS